MPKCWLILFVIAVFAGKVAGQSQPEKAFPFSEEERYTPRAPFPRDEGTRKKILRSLSTANRDKILKALVRSVQVGKEIWFDLRGIRVRSHEITHNADLSRICWDNSQFEGVDMAQAELSGALLRNVVFTDVDLHGANIDNAYLEYAEFAGCNLKSVNFRLVRPGKHTKFLRCNLDEARFDNSMYLDGVEFSSGSMRQAILANTRAQSTRFLTMDLTGTDFSEADLSFADFYRSTIDGVNFTDTNLTGAKLQFTMLNSPLRLIRTRLFETFLGDLDVSKVDVAYVDWHEHHYALGEEIEGDQIADFEESRSSLEEKRRLYQQAEMVYRSLAEKYRSSGHTEEYLALRYRSLETRRKLLSLESGSHFSLESAWLNLSRIVDSYGTSFRALLRSFLVTVLLFAAVYLLGWTVLGRDWGAWYLTSPSGMLMMNETGKFIRGDNPPPLEYFQKHQGSSRFLAFISLSGEAIWFSLEATFMFTEKAVGIPDILNLLRKREERLVPLGFARVLVGIQAISGLLLLCLAARTLVRMAGWS